MIQEVINRVSYMVENHDAVKVSVFKGEVSHFQLRFNNETGAASAFGSIKCEKEWTSKSGKEGKETYYANFSAFGDIAMSMSLKEGDKVIMLTESSSNKGKDGKWYNNNNVILCNKLG